jgi:hypothetical protein
VKSRALIETEKLRLVSGFQDEKHRGVRQYDVHSGPINVLSVDDKFMNLTDWNGRKELWKKP